MENFFRRYLPCSIFLLLCLLAVALPLATDVSAYLTFEPIKVLVFVAGGMALFFLLLLFAPWAITRRVPVSLGWRSIVRVRSPFVLMLPFILFFASLVLSTVFSAAPWVSFWGLYPRYHGFLLLGSAFLVFATVFYIPGHLARRVVDVSLVAGSVVGLIGVSQRFFPGLTQYWDIAFFLERTFSTLGHPNFLADYLLYLLPVFFYGFLFRKRWWIWLILASPALLAFLLTLSRGAILGFIVATCLFGCVYAFWKRRFAFLGFALIFPTFLLILFVYANVHYTSTFTTSTNFIQRLKVSGENLRSIESRFILWPVALKYGFDRPILGHGPDMFAYTFAPFTPQKLLEAEDFRSYADRAHNILLDTFGMLGGLGVVALLGIIGVMFWIVMRIRDPYLLALFCGIFGVFVSQQFGFPISAHYFLFWLFSGVIVREGVVWFASRGSGSRSVIVKSAMADVSERMNKKAMSVIVIIFLVGVTVVGFAEYRFVYLPWIADREVRAANEQFEEGSVEHASLLTQIVAMAPQRMQYQMLLARSLVFALVSDANTSGVGSNSDERVKLRERTFNVLSRLEKESSGRDFRVYWLFGQLFSESGDVARMKESYGHALQIAPMYSTLWYSYGSELFSAGLYEEALATWRHYVSLAPTYWELAEKYKQGKLTPWEKNRYEVFYKQNPDFDAVFGRIDEVKSKIEQNKIEQKAKLDAKAKR